MNEDDNHHSELPPSSSDKWMVCGAWLRLNRGLPEGETSEAAEEGTKAHSYLQHFLVTQMKWVVGEAPHLPELEDEEMYDYLQSCVEWVAEQPGMIYSEVEVDFGQAFGYADLTGTADVIVVNRNTLLVADLKYGKGLVEVKNNTQLLIYLVGAVQKFGRRPDYGIAILQPRGVHSGGPFREFWLSDEELQDFELELEKAIHRNYNRGDAVIGDHCRKWCKALGVCPAVADYSIRLFRETPIED